MNLKMALPFPSLQAFAAIPRKEKGCKKLWDKLLCLSFPLDNMNMNRGSYAESSLSQPSSQQPHSEALPSHLPKPALYTSFGHRRPYQSASKDPPWTLLQSHTSAEGRKAPLRDSGFVAAHFEACAQGLPCLPYAA